MRGEGNCLFFSEVGVAWWVWCLDFAGDAGDWEDDGGIVHRQMRIFVLAWLALINAMVLVALKRVYDVWVVTA